MSTLSNDLIKEILSRLPVKSLCRFKCVSKDWQFLISHPLFVKMHFSKTRTLERRIVLSDSLHNLHSINLERVSSEADAISSVCLEFPGGRKDRIDYVMCMGSCHGLLAVLMAVRQLFVYNPSTQEFKKISGVDRTDDKILYGFGYNESIDDYKIVKILRSRKGTYVYSLRKRSWKSCPSNFDLSGKCCHFGVSLNGAVHWAFKKPKGLCVIAAFDLAQEKFKTLPPPRYNLRADKNKLYHLGILRGRLCMDTITGDGFNQIWVMEEYGMKGSWTRFLIPRSFSELKPVSYLNNSETVLLMTEQGLVFWNVKDGTLKNVEVGMFFYSPELEGYSHFEVVTFRQKLRWCDAYVYEESLVPLPYNPDEIAEDSVMHNKWFS